MQTLHVNRHGWYLALALLLTFVSGPALAQPNGNEMCGDGTTFTVPLPAEGSTVGDDSVTLPNGCRIYAVLVSGYARNYEFDELTFFKLARFVMANNGYVHHAWWNNLLREYMGGPLHDDSFRMPVTGTIITATPGNLIGVHALGFVPPTVIDLVPKAVPEEDHQFQADAKRMLAAIRARNPNAIIIVAGHRRPEWGPGCTVHGPRGTGAGTVAREGRPVPLRLAHQSRLDGLPGAGSDAG